MIYVQYYGIKSDLKTLDQPFHTQRDSSIAVLQCRGCPGRYAPFNQLVCVVSHGVTHGRAHGYLRSPPLHLFLHYSSSEQRFAPIIHSKKPSPN